MPAIEDHLLRRKSGGPRADHGKGGESRLRLYPPRGEKGKNGGGRAERGRSRPETEKGGTDRGGGFFRGAAVCIHGADAALRPARPAPAGHLLHAHPSGKLRRLAAASTRWW